MTRKTEERYKTQFLQVMPFYISVPNVAAKKKYNVCKYHNIEKVVEDNQSLQKICQFTVREM